MSLEDKHEMVKPIKIDQKRVKKAHESGHKSMPIHIIDGDESLEAEGQTIEIDFSRVNSKDDINIDLDEIEVEVLDTEKGEMICWLNLEELEQREEINIYYGDSE